MPPNQQISTRQSDGNTVTVWVISLDWGGLPILCKDEGCREGWDVSRSTGLNAQLDSFLGEYIRPEYATNLKNHG